VTGRYVNKEVETGRKGIRKHEDCDSETSRHGDGEADRYRDKETGRR